MVELFCEASGHGSEVHPDSLLSQWLSVLHDSYFLCLIILAKPRTNLLLRYPDVKF